MLSVPLALPFATSVVSSVASNSAVGDARLDVGVGEFEPAVRERLRRHGDVGIES